MIVPISGTVTWKSDSTSRRKLSNSMSARSISSMRRTGARSGCVMAWSSGRFRRKVSEKMSASFSGVARPSRSSSRIRRICFG